MVEMKVLKVLHVEDQDVKARSVGRWLTSVARSRGFAVEVVRAKTLAEANALDFSDFGLVVSDWCFPLNAETAPYDGAGASVIETAARAGVVSLVISGGMRFPSYRGPAIWENDWEDGIRKALDSVERAA